MVLAVVCYYPHLNEASDASQCLVKLSLWFVATPHSLASTPNQAMRWCKTGRKRSYFHLDDSFETKFWFCKAVHCHVCVSQCHISHLPKIKSQPASAAPSCAESDVSSLRKMSHISLNMKYELPRRSTLGSYFLIFYFTLICLAFVQAKSSANLW